MILGLPNIERRKMEMRERGKKEWVRKAGRK
jgi:hypothetical protein